MITFKANIIGVIINSLIWSTMMMIPLIFFLNHMGLRSDYVLFIFPVGAVSWGFFDVVANATALIGDITGEKSISYELSLPVPQELIFIKIALANAYRALVGSFLMLPYGMLFVYFTKGLVYTNLSAFKFILVMIEASLFYGFFGLFAASIMTNVSSIRMVWMRMLLPLWWVGGFNYSWSVMYKGLPLFAYIMFLNPILYISEAARGAALGPQDFLPYWPCVFIIAAWTLFFAVVSIKRMKKRLDCL